LEVPAPVTERSSVTPFHRVHRLFHRLGDLRLGLLDGGAGQRRADGDLRQVDRGESIDPERK
jgi:hypothetical protein